MINLPFYSKPHVGKGAVTGLGKGADKIHTVMDGSMIAGDAAVSQGKIASALVTVILIIATVLP